MDYRSRLVSMKEDLDLMLEDLCKEHEKIVAALKLLDKIDKQESFDQERRPRRPATPNPTIASAIVRILEDSGGMMTTKEIADQLKKERNTTRGAAYTSLVRLKKQGKVSHGKRKRGGHSLWSLAKKTDRVPPPEDPSE